MKAIFTIMILISNLVSFPQSNKVAGDYSLTIQTNENNVFEYNLTLSEDGTFSYHYHSKIIQGIPPEVNKYAKGKWTEKNNVISFSCDKQKDLDEKNTLDFTNTKARFVTKSPRDKTDKIIKTKLMFLESEIFWMKRIDLFKI
jgi:hypothetical protein